MTLVSDFFFSTCDDWFWKQEGFLLIHFFFKFVFPGRKVQFLFVSVYLCVARWHWGFEGLWCSVVWRGVTSPPESFAVKTEPKHVWVCVCERAASSETWDFEHVITMSDCCFYGHFVVLSFSCWNSFYIRGIQQEALEDGFLMKRGGEGCFRGGVWWKRSKGRIRIHLPCHYLTVPQSK